MRRAIMDWLGLLICIPVVLVFFGIAMLPQFGLAFFIKYGGGPMLPPIIAIGIIGYSTRQTDFQKYALPAAALMVLVMAMMRGFYWHIFERGHGFFTANRVSAIAIYLAVYISAQLLARKHAETKVR